jgi:hypothetical protein
MRLDFACALSALAETQGTFPPVSPVGRPVAAPERTDEREAPGTHKQVRSATGLHSGRRQSRQGVAKRMQPQLRRYGIASEQVCRRRLNTEHLTPVENCAIHQLAQ